MNLLPAYLLNILKNKIQDKLNNLIFSGCEVEPNLK